MNVLTLDGKFKFEKPNECRHCQKGMDPKIIQSFSYDFDRESNFVIVFQCPCCNELMFAFYRFYPGVSRGIYRPTRIIGGEQITHVFSNEIAALSPRFTKTYNEAYYAEQLGLNEITGMGYRRAFEILFKDFALKIDPENAESIIKQDLSKLIPKYAPDEETRELLEKTAWIGNDFAHFKNWHEEISIQDLRELILYVAQAIESNIKRKELISKIQKK